VFPRVVGTSSCGVYTREHADLLALFSETRTNLRDRESYLSPEGARIIDLENAHLHPHEPRELPEI